MSQPMAAQIEFSKPGDLAPQWVLFQLVTGHYVSRAIYAAAKLGIADLLKSGPLHYTKLAKECGTHPPSLYRLMLLLTSAGVFEEREAECFGLTPVGEYLQTGVPGSRHAQALLLAGPAQQRAWSGLLDVVKTGKTPSGRSAFQFFAKYPEEGAIFNEGIAAGSAEAASAVAAAYDFAPFGTIVDVGGGHGVLLTTILAANPALRGILFDLPHASEGAEKQMETAGLRGRCEFVAGDFLEQVPGGADAYILKSVIHDWDDTRSVAILRNIHHAMAQQGKLLLVEMTLPARVDQTHMSQIIAGSDVNMMVNVGGQERTAAQFSALLDAAGFRLTRIIPTQGLWSVIEGVPSA
jgi:O-methyltransferase domain/Dimerisation domain